MSQGGASGDEDPILKAERDKLFHLISETAKREHWIRKKTYFHQKTTYLFHYKREELILTFHPGALEFKLRPQDAPHALHKIAQVLKQFYAQNPNSKLTLIVTLLNTHESRVKAALKNMLQKGIPIDKIVMIKGPGGEAFPKDELLKLIQEVKAEANRKPPKP